MIHVLVVIILVGVIWFAVHKFLGDLMHPWALRAFDLVVVIALLLWILTLFGILPLADMPVPRVR